MLGDLVNVIARHMREQAGHYMRDIKAPAMKLLGLYSLQVRYTEALWATFDLLLDLWQI